MVSCKKDISNNELKLSYQMLGDKTWYLDYAKLENITKTYIGQPTYFINFLKDKNTYDSDGLTGSYTIEKIDNKLQIHVQASTKQLNPIEYIYNIESIGSKYLVLSYTNQGKITKLYYSTK